MCTGAHVYRCACVLCGVGQEGFYAEEGETEGSHGSWFMVHGSWFMVHIRTHRTQIMPPLNRWMNRLLTTNLVSL